MSSNPIQLDPCLTSDTEPSQYHAQSAQTIQKPQSIDAFGYDHQSKTKTELLQEGLTSRQPHRDIFLTAQDPDCSSGKVEGFDRGESDMHWSEQLRWLSRKSQPSSTAACSNAGPVNATRLVEQNQLENPRANDRFIRLGWEIEEIRRRLNEDFTSD